MYPVLRIDQLIHTEIGCQELEGGMNGKRLLVVGPFLQGDEISEVRRWE